MPYQNTRQSWALQRAKTLLAPLRKMLRTGDDHDTSDRLFNSRHVGDLQVIAGVGLLGVEIIIGLTLIVMAYEAAEPALVKIVTADTLHAPSIPGLLAWGLTVVQAFVPVTTVIAPVIAVYGAVLAWAYKTGSERLGVVDSFACEIGTLCRGAAVLDSVGRSIERFHRMPGTRPAADAQKEPPPVSVSQENYFPVFENCTKDLQVLEAKVVVNITAFYTFMKAVRDSMRALADIPNLPEAGDPASQECARLKVWQEKVRDLIYMMFLGFESARRALNVLVEYEPDHDELIVAVLLSELKAYGFLCRQYEEAQDVRYWQLMLRRPTYEEWVTKVCNSVEAGWETHKDWGRAYKLLPALRQEYSEAMGEKSSVAVAS